MSRADKRIPMLKDLGGRNLGNDLGFVYAKGAAVDQWIPQR